MWTREDIPDQHGRVAVVTGANAGLGAEVAGALARKGAAVIMAVRDQHKAREAEAAIRSETPAAALEIQALDLASLASVRACAERVLAEHPRIDLLVNNAGVMGVSEQATAEGFELQLGVNHLGHFVLTRGLLPALAAAPAARVVSVTSFSRLVGRTIRAGDPHLRRGYRPWAAYGQAKLANLQFALELHRRLTAAGSGIRSVAAHPGLTLTGLQARSVEGSGGGRSQRFWLAAARRAGMPPGQGALPLLRAASDPEASGGELYGPRWMTFGPPTRRPVLRRSPHACRTVWAVSEIETGERFDVAALVGTGGAGNR